MTKNYWQWWKKLWNPIQLVITESIEPYYQKSKSTSVTKSILAILTPCHIISAIAFLQSAASHWRIPELTEDWMAPEWPSKILCKMVFKLFFIRRDTLLCLYRKPNPWKTQKARHHMPHTPSTNTRNPKNQTQNPNLKPPAMRKIEGKIKYSE